MSYFDMYLRDPTKEVKLSTLNKTPEEREQAENIWKSMKEIGTKGADPIDSKDYQAIWSTGRRVGTKDFADALREGIAEGFIQPRWRTRSVGYLDKDFKYHFYQITPAVQYWRDKGFTYEQAHLIDEEFQQRLKDSITLYEAERATDKTR